MTIRSNKRPRRRFVLISDYTNDSGVGIQAQLWCTQLADLDLSITVLTARSRHTPDDRIQVRTIAPRVPYSIRVLLVTLLGLLLNLTRTKFDSFEIFGINCRSFHMHSDPFDASKLNGLAKHKKVFRVTVRKLQILSLKRAIKTGIPIVFPSSGLAEKIFKQSEKTSNFFIVPNALLDSDAVIEKHRSLIEKESFDSITNLEQLKIGFVAQGDLEYKGLGLAIAKLEESMKNIVLEVVGVKPLDLDFSSSHIVINFLGHLTRDKYVTWLGEINGLVVASKFESFSMCSYESILLGKPVIARSYIGLSEFYKGKLLLNNFESFEQFYNLAKKDNFPDISNGDLFQKRLSPIKMLLESENG